MSAPDGPVRVQVRGLASSGAGVADLPDGRVVFVHGTAPGDEATVVVEREKARWATARLEAVHTPGPDRVEPPCPLFGTCGGCTLQHVAYAEQLRWKGRFVADALERIGGVTMEPPEVEPSQDAYHYRNRITLTLRRLRNGRVVAGFHALDRAGHVVDMRDECLLPGPAILATWGRLRAVWGPGANRLPDGGRLRLALHAVGHDAADLLVEGGDPGWRGGGLVDDVDRLRSVWHQPSPDEPAVQVAGDAGGSPRAFSQVNEAVGDRLRQHVLEQVGTPERVVDAYCGAGAYGRPLAEAGVRVTGIEVEPQACARARDGAPSGFSVVEGQVEDHLARVLPADVVVVNPPRTGLHDDIPGILLDALPTRIVYVSCDPATLARDVKRLAAGYEPAALRSFDLFPQTAHVETVAVLHARKPA